MVRWEDEGRLHEVPASTAAEPPNLDNRQVGSEALGVFTFFKAAF